MIADLASAYKIKVIFASVLPVSDYHKDVNPAYERTPGRPPVLIKALNDWLEHLCSQRGYTYLNYYPAMLDNAGELKEDLGDDGLHPNAEGLPDHGSARARSDSDRAGAGSQEAQQKPSRRHQTSR